MNRLDKLVCGLVLAVLLVACGAIWAAGQDGNPAKKVEPPVVEPPVVAAPEKERLTWENARLRIANIELQIQALQNQREKLAADADKLLEQMTALMPGREPFIDQDGILKFRLKPPPIVPKKEGEKP